MAYQVDGKQVRVKNLVEIVGFALSAVVVEGQEPKGPQRAQTSARIFCVGGLKQAMDLLLLPERKRVTILKGYTVKKRYGKDT